MARSFQELDLSAESFLYSTLPLESQWLERIQGTLGKWPERYHLVKILFFNFFLSF
jgi:hypothetical protein